MFLFKTKDDIIKLRARIPETFRIWCKHMLLFVINICQIYIQKCEVIIIIIVSLANIPDAFDNLTTNGSQRHNNQRCNIYLTWRIAFTQASQGRFSKTAFSQTLFQTHKITVLDKYRFISKIYLLYGDIK